MKKTFIIICSMLLILGMTATAFAVHPSEPAEQVPIISKGAKIEIGGSLRFRGDHRNDLYNFTFDAQDRISGTSLTSLAASESTNKSDYDMRVRIHLNAYVTDNTMGRIHLQTGDREDRDGDAWGCGGFSEASGVYREGNCAKDELQVLEAWIQHEGSGLLGMPAGIKIGHFPVILGRGIFLNHTRFGDDGIDVFVKAADNVTLDFVYLKHTEGSATDNDDDTDSYTVIGSYTGDMFNASADVTYLRDKNLGSIDGADLWNIGVRGDIDVNQFNIYGDVEFQTGSINAVPGLTSGFLSNDADFGGYAVVVGATTKMNDIGLNLEFGYGSGDDNFTDDDVDTFITSQSDIKKYTYVYDYRQVTAAAPASNQLGGDLDDTGIANTTYIKLGATTKATPALSVGADIYWLQASEDVQFSDGSKDDDIGWEIDGKATYKIDTNLQYFIEGGILFAGDIYDKALDLPTGAGDKEADDNPWVVRHGIQLSF